MTYPVLCTRTTRTKRPCRGASVQWSDITALPDPRACYGHLTPAEQAAWAQHRAEEEAAWERFLAAEPVCWRWPAVASTVTPQDPYEATMVAVLPMPAEDAEDTARRVLAHWQDGRCAICGHRRDLVEDHDHSTGLVRGYLCQQCNTQEARHREGAPLFDRYRAKPPAVLLGLTVRYLHPVTGEYSQPQAERDDADAWVDAASEGIGL